MPKAAIDENRQPLSRKNEIRTARNRLMPTPSGDRLRPKNSDDF